MVWEKYGLLVWFLVWFMEGKGVIMMFVKGFVVTQAYEISILSKTNTHNIMLCLSKKAKRWLCRNIIKSILITSPIWLDVISSCIVVKLTLFCSSKICHNSNFVWCLRVLYQMYLMIIFNHSSNWTGILCNKSLFQCL